MSDRGLDFQGDRVREGFDDLLSGAEILDEVRVAHVARANLKAAAQRVRRLFEESLVAASVVTDHGADFGPLARQLLGQMAADEAAGSGDGDSNIRPVHGGHAITLP